MKVLIDSYNCSNRINNWNNFIFHTIMEEKEALPITFSEPITNDIEEPMPFEVTLPYEEVTESFYVERPADITPSFECFVQKQASYGLLDGKYLIRY